MLQWIISGIVLFIICVVFPFSFYLFGAENGCGETRWQKLKEKLFKKSE